MNTHRLGVAALLGLAFAVSTAHAAQPDPNRFIVKFQPGKSAQARAALANAGARVALDLPDAVAAVLTPGAVQALSRNPNVEYVEPDVVRYPLALTTPSTGTPYATGQLVPYGIGMVQADQLAAVNAANRKICIIDSGLDRTHEDLAANFAAGNVTGEDDAGTGHWDTDENHHGTHVAGTIAAIDQSGVGVVGVHAHAQLRLHIIKVFGADGWAYSSTLSAAANKCAAAGANVISMSLGGSLSNRTEQSTFDTLYSKKSILSVAAAGNGGNSRNSYPASYASVMSVAAVDENKAWASFSQYNKQVEIAAPGVGVLSTLPMGTGSRSTLSVGAAGYAAGDMEGSPQASVTAPLADFGLGNATMASMSGKVCLIQRGSIDFATKVSNCQASGGVGAVIYNNVAGAFSGTLGTTVTSVPSVSASDTDGAAMKLQLGQSATVAVTAWNYAYYDGTSMSTPHVAAVAALVWSRNTACTAAQLRSVLTGTALDLGTAGRDTRYGYGLVQARKAYDALPTTASCK